MTTYRQNAFTAPSGVAENPPVAMSPAEPSHTTTGERDGKAAGGTFFDTEETIRPTTPEEDAAYAAIGEEIKEDAAAILATCGFMLTGYETTVCEYASGVDNGMLGVPMGLFESLRTQFSREIAEFKNAAR